MTLVPWQRGLNLPPGVTPTVPGGLMDVPPLLGRPTPRGGLLAAFNNPMFMMGANLLANSGPSSTPVSFGQALGRSVLQTNQMQQARQQSALRNYLLSIQAQNAKAEQQAAAQAAANRERATQAFGAWQRGEIDNRQFAGELFATGYENDAMKLIDPQEATTLQRNLQAAGYAPGTPQFHQAMRDYLAKPSTQINMGPQLPTGYQWRNPTNPQAGVVPIPGGPATKPTAQEAQGQALRETAVDSLNRLRGLVDSGKVSVGPASNLWRETFEVTTGLGLSEDEADAISLAESVSNQVLQAMRGAQVGPKEQERFEKQLPRLGQPKELFLKNLDLTLKNLEYLNRRTEQLRGRGNGSPPGKPTLSPGEQKRLDALRRKQGGM